MNRNEFVIATAIVLLLAFTLGWFAQLVIQRFRRVSAADMGELERLHAALADPFTDREDDYVRRPPDWGKRLEVSCSS